MADKVKYTDLHLADLDFIHLQQQSAIDALEYVLGSEQLLELGQKRIEQFALLKKAYDKGDQKQYNLYSRSIEQLDLKLSQAIYIALAGAAVKRQDEVVNMSELLKSLPPEKQEEAQELCVKLDSVTFMADVIEGYLFDINEMMKSLFDGKFGFMQMDHIMPALKRLKRCMRNTRDIGTEDEKELFCDYAESIEAYMDKRMKTFHKRVAELNKKSAVSESA